MRARCSTSASVLGTSRPTVRAKAPASVSSRGRAEETTERSSNAKAGKFLGRIDSAEIGSARSACQASSLTTVPSRSRRAAYRRPVARRSRMRSRSFSQAGSASAEDGIEGVPAIRVARSTRPSSEAGSAGFAASRSLAGRPWRSSYDARAAAISAMRWSICPHRWVESMIDRRRATRDRRAADRLDAIDEVGDDVVPFGELVRRPNLRL